MSKEHKDKSAAADEATAAASDEITEEQLESVSGGILIGLNQPSALNATFKDAVGHKDIKLQSDGLSVQGITDKIRKG